MASHSGRERSKRHGRRDEAVREVNTRCGLAAGGCILRTIIFREVVISEWSAGARHVPPGASQGARRTANLELGRFKLLLYALLRMK